MLILLILAALFVAAVGPVMADEPLPPEHPLAAVLGESPVEFVRAVEPPGVVDALEALYAGGAFSDDDGSIFEADIEWLAAEGITRGCNPPSNTMFCPNR
jgi:hypothetical protein